jgi:hypothetical protein
MFINCDDCGGCHKLMPVQRKDGSLAYEYVCGGSTCYIYISAKPVSARAPLAMGPSRN